MPVFCSVKVSSLQVSKLCRVGGKRGKVDKSDIERGRGDFGGREMDKRFNNEG